MTHFSHATENHRVNHLVVSVLTTAVVVLAGLLSLAQFATV